MLAQCRVVLVRTHYPGNIGSAARAMKNFGLTDLVLVDPIADIKAHEARMLATNGVDLLNSAQIVPTLFDALQGCGMVLATAGEVDGTERETKRGSPDELFPQFLAALHHGPSALVFGPEPHGLSNEDLALCHALLHLPTDPAYTSLNLSLSVGITLYELRRLMQTHLFSGIQRWQRPPASFEDLDRALVHLETSLRELRFLYGQNADQLMQGFRHMITRALPTSQEVGMLHGLAKQLHYAGDQMRKAEAILRPPTS